jgi:hypothetical protein
VPVVFLDADWKTGIYKQAQYFEGELHYSTVDDYVGYVHIKKYIGPGSRWTGQPAWYKGRVKRGIYNVWVDDGQGAWMLYGYGSGKQGIVIRPSWLPDVEKIAAQLPKEEGKE